MELAEIWEPERRYIWIKRWLETHRYDCFCEDDSLYFSETIDTDETITTDQFSESPPPMSLLESDEYEQQLIDKIDEAVLTMVFPGLLR